MTQKPTFKDHFSSRAAAYTRYRPSYPPELFAWLATLVESHATAWDCGCGNGQAALGLVPHFRRVLATDPSREQIAHAVRHDRIAYAVAPAEASGLESAAVDLIVVAQALHWFAFDRFYAEARRVARPGAVLAAVTYGELRFGGEIDRLLDRLYFEIVGPCWPPERRYVDERYRTLPFPFPELEAPPFVMTADWDLEHLLGYLGTWSAVKEYQRQHRADPLALVEPELRAAWGEPAQTRPVVWPLALRVGRIVGGPS